MMDHVSWFVETYVQRNKELLIVILAILIVRLFMKKMPKKYVYCLWTIVGIRMLIPLTIPSPVSIYQFFPWVEANVQTEGLGLEGKEGLVEDQPDETVAVQAEEEDIPDEKTWDHPVDDKEALKKDAQQVRTSAIIFGLPVSCEEIWNNPENHIHYERRYYYKDILVGKSSGYGESRDYADDLDGDGITELICYTCEMQTGNYDDVTVFRRVGNSIYMGRLVEYGSLELTSYDALSATGRISTHYDPTRIVFT